MKNDCAVAPVVAGLLILAVIVTVMSVYFNTYVPSLKEEAEIEHLSNVEREFLSFSSDIDNAVSQKSEGKVSRSFELGGGDVFLSSIKSGGTLQVEADAMLFGFNVTALKDDSTTNITGWNSSLVNFSYQPLSNFWHDQGYSWQYGYVNLTTEYGKQTPLQYKNMSEVKEEVRNDIDNSSGLFSSLFDMTYKYDYFNDTENNHYRNCTDLDITIVNFKKGRDSYASGNGAAELRLETNVPYLNRTSNATMLNFAFYDCELSEVKYAIWKNINNKLISLQNRGLDNVIVSDGSNDVLGV
ncbi:MAG: flagellin, partial [Methanomicrobium sp.]|nr:flagellin [Methanomicrobium sp.]